MAHNQATTAGPAPCRPDDDPQVLLACMLRQLQRILATHPDQEIRRCWIAQPYGEQDIALLRQDLLPLIQHCLARLEELDERLLAQQELLLRCQLEADRAALSALQVVIV